MLALRLYLLVVGLNLTTPILAQDLLDRPIYENAEIVEANTPSDPAAREQMMTNQRDLDRLYRQVIDSSLQASERINAMTDLEVFWQGRQGEPINERYRLELLYKIATAEVIDADLRNAAVEKLMSSYKNPDHEKRAQGFKSSTNSRWIFEIALEQFVMDFSKHSSMRETSVAYNYVSELLRATRDKRLAEGEVSNALSAATRAMTSAVEGRFHVELAEATALLFNIGGRQSHMDRSLANYFQKIVNHAAERGTTSAFFETIHGTLLERALKTGELQLDTLAKSAGGHEMLYLVSCALTGRKPS